MVPVVSLVVYQKSQSALTFSVWLLIFQGKQKFLWYFCHGNSLVFSSLKNHKICRSDSLRCPHGRRAPRFHTYFRPNTAIHYLSPHIYSRVTGGWISPSSITGLKFINQRTHICSCFFFSPRSRTFMYLQQKEPFKFRHFEAFSCSLLKGWAEPTVEWIHSSAAVFLRWIMLLVPCVTHLTDRWRVKSLRQAAYSAQTLTPSQTAPRRFTCGCLFYPAPRIYVSRKLHKCHHMDHHRAGYLPLP